MNNSRYYTESYKQGQAAKIERNFGPVAEHTKVCERCSKEYKWKGRIKTKAFSRSKYCSRSCANNRQAYWNDNATHYKTIAYQHWPKECAICGFDKAVAVHHVDENHSNNDPNNLIPLCPNHHEMYHSKYKAEVAPLINEALKNRISGD